MIQIPWSVTNLYRFHSNPKKLLHYDDVEFIFDQEILDDMVWVYIDWKNDYEDEMALGDYVVDLFHDVNLPHSIEVFMNADTEDNWDTIDEVCKYIEWFYKNSQSSVMYGGNYSSKPQPTSEGFMEWYKGDSK